MRASTGLEHTAKEVFSLHGWRCNLRIGTIAPWAGLFYFLL
jgi:hypothetical protein